MDRSCKQFWNKTKLVWMRILQTICHK